MDDQSYLKSQQENQKENRGNMLCKDRSCQAGYN
jgi:hypothetical protein